ncbi:hypothetical protein Glove_109g212 [Diversispora epigaea]|uniref:Protein kinase domain-containing protein n=1 Tax=Diversispora epigaea TaxID=1348612 RepID=A0A397J2N4_9GLOM|nr:hypothetical protein Glove_109g212 [Diversispora epigaea]
MNDPSTSEEDQKYRTFKVKLYIEELPTLKVIHERYPTLTSKKCSKCHRDNIGRNWCNPCNAKQFQNEFDKWTSGDREIDKFIQQMQLEANKCLEIIEWIPFNRLENVRYLTKGVLAQNGKQDVCLKSLNNLTNKNDFLQEIKNQLKFRGKDAIAIYGITKNQTENEYMMVMNYAKYGSLREVLNINFKKLTWWRKSSILLEIVKGLKNIHEMGLMHKDFHPGNIVNQSILTCYITDFGLCKPVTENDPENIYGVIPYMAPETLSRGEYTQESDIYSFDYETRKQVKAANKSNKNFIQYDPNVMHPEAIYTSRHLPFLKSKKFETHDTKQWDFVVPDDIRTDKNVKDSNSASPFPENQIPLFGSGDSLNYISPRCVEIFIASKAIIFQK